jgi:hypothetical protein
MPIDRMLEDHRRILVAAERLEAIASGARPDTAEDLMRERWDFTRDILMHITGDEGLVLLPLMQDRRPHVALLAAHSLAEFKALCQDYQVHMRRWPGLPEAAQWADYCREMLGLIRRLRARIASEEAGIYRLLPAQRDEITAEAGPRAAAA